MELTRDGRSEAKEKEAENIFNNMLFFRNGKRSKLLALMLIYTQFIPQVDSLLRLLNVSDEHNVNKFGSAAFLEESLI